MGFCELGIFKECEDNFIWKYSHEVKYATCFGQVQKSFFWDCPRVAALGPYPIRRPLLEKLVGGALASSGGLVDQDKVNHIFRVSKSNPRLPS